MDIALKGKMIKFWLNLDENSKMKTYFTGGG
jgi:hypothetical protein